MSEAFAAALARGREARRAVENCMCLDDEGLSVLPCSCSTWAAEALGDILNAAPRWIPCSERMPEPGVEVLVVRRSSPEFAPSMYLSAHHPGRGYYVWQSAEIDFEADEVPCWMPLPPLPEA